MNTSGSKQKNFPITNIGSVTLLMIFIVLCMITFAALSLSSAASDYQTARKSATHAQEYYKASGRAEETLAKIDQVLKNCYLQTSRSERASCRERVEGWGGGGGGERKEGRGG